MLLVKFRHIEISRKIGSTIFGYGVIAALLVVDLYQAAFSELFQPPFERPERELSTTPFDIKINHSWRFGDASLLKILKNNIIFFIHPVTSPTPNHSIPLTICFIMSLLKLGRLGIILCRFWHGTMTAFNRHPDYGHINRSPGALRASKVRGERRSAQTRWVA